MFQHQLPLHYRLYIYLHQDTHQHNLQRQEKEVTKNLLIQELRAIIHQPKGTDPFRLITIDLVVDEVVAVEATPMEDAKEEPPKSL